MPADEVPEETEWIGNMDRRMMAPSRRPIADKVAEKGKKLKIKLFLLSQAHCTIIAMVGLPGVGKTTWVRQYLKEHPDENWILLNTDTVLQVHKSTISAITRGLSPEIRKNKKNS